MTVRMSTDLARGGRWTSLRTGSREWLWQNPVVTLAERAAARPGTPFVDAGGGEECLPSVGGDPAAGLDHGDVWHRPWVGVPDDAAAQTRDGLTLRRRVRHDDEHLRVDYAVTGAPGTPFLHAVHLLLDLSTDARLHVPGTPDVVVPDHPEVGAVTRTRWPDAGGLPLDRLGPDDGTAVCAVVVSDAVEVHDGEDVLALRWGSEPGAPTSFLVWRNLGGWPAGAPYRSFGVEPMLGAATALADAAPGEAAVLGPSGRLDWWLEVRGA